MQLLLIAAIVFAVGAVAFALQNDVPVTVTFLVWRFDGSLALVLLLALGLGALVAALVSTPSVIRGQWNSKRLRRQLAGLTRDKEALEARCAELERSAQRLSPQAAPPAGNSGTAVGLRSLMGAVGEQRPES